MWRWLILSLLLLSFSSAPAEPAAPKIAAEPLSLDPSDPANLTVGRLRYLQGWVLTSDDPHFGGLSALRIAGGRFLALSDAGWLFSFAQRGSGFSPPTSLPLRDRRGMVATEKIERDSESMTLSPDGRQMWVGLEERNAIWRYGDPAAPAEAQIMPAAMKRWKLDAGPETLLRFDDGRFLVISEDSEGPGGARDALLYDRDPTMAGAQAIRFGYRPPRGFMATDAAQLADGRVVVLNRRFSLLNGFAAALTIIDPKAIRPDAVVVGDEIARIAPPLSIDNMEGLAIEQDGRRTILWIVSDDNFSPVSGPC